MNIKRTLGAAFGGLGIALSIPAAAFAASTVVVTPTNTQGWSTADTRPGGAVNYVNDATAPLGTGALQLTTDSTNAAKAQYLTANHAGTSLSSVNDLSYQTKQVSGAAVADPSYQLGIDLDGNLATTNDQTNLVYEPYWNGTVTPGVWQSWDVDAGQFWSSKTIAGTEFVNGAGGPPFYTLAAVQAAHPTAVVTTLGVNIGSFNPNYNVYTDAFNFNGTVYNFEVKAVAPTDKDQCKDGGWKNFQTDYKNQGQCVSSVASNKNKSNDNPSVLTQIGNFFGL